MKRTFGLTVAFGILLTGAPASHAQAAGASSAPETNPVTNMMRKVEERQAKNTIAAAEAMPADKYDYKPTPAQITFGHLVVHIINANNQLCGKYGGVTTPGSDEFKDTDAKDKLVPALKASFDVCTQVLAKADDSNLGEQVKIFGDRPISRAGALIALASEFADHYGMQAMYLRMNGLVPPTAQKDKM